MRKELNLATIIDSSEAAFPWPPLRSAPLRRRVLFYWPGPGLQGDFHQGPRNSYSYERLGLGTACLQARRIYFFRLGGQLPHLARGWRQV